MALEPGALEPPSAEATIAVLLGASEYPRKPAWTNPVLGASARAFRDYVLSPWGLALNPGSVLDLFDNETQPVDQLLQIKEFLATAGRGARDLVLYYVGHGGFDNDEYYLGIRNTQRDHEFITTIESKKLARVIRGEFGRKRVYVILDSCFSGSAASDWQGDEIDVAVRKMAQPLPQQGTAFLAAASKYDVTRAPRAERYTVFTGAVLEALTRGVDSAQPKLSMYELYEIVRELLRHRETDAESRPELHVPSQRDGDVSQLRMFPNAAYLRAADAARLHLGATVRAEVTENATSRERGKNRARAAAAAGDQDAVRGRSQAGVRVRDNTVVRSADFGAATTATVRGSNEPLAEAQIEAAKRAIALDAVEKAAYAAYVPSVATFVGQVVAGASASATRATAADTHLRVAVSTSKPHVPRSGRTPAPFVGAAAVALGVSIVSVIVYVAIHRTSPRHDGDESSLNTTGISTVANVGAPEGLVMPDAVTTNRATQEPKRSMEPDAPIANIATPDTVTEGSTATTPAVRPPTSSSTGSGPTPPSKAADDRLGKRTPQPTTTIGRVKPAANDNSIAALVYRAKAFERDGKWTEARAVYQRLETIKGYSRGEALYQEAYAAFQANELDEAVQLSREAAFQPGPFKTPAQFLYGDAFYRQGDFTRAKNIYVTLRGFVRGDQRAMATVKIAACNKELKLPDRDGIYD